MIYTDKWWIYEKQSPKEMQAPLFLLIPNFLVIILIEIEVGQYIFLRMPLQHLLRIAAADPVCMSPLLYVVDIDAGLLYCDLCLFTFVVYLL
jgi:hypothetical protein